jgi:hypothetical protein
MKFEVVLDLSPLPLYFGGLVLTPAGMKMESNWFLLGHHIILPYFFLGYVTTLSLSNYIVLDDIVT